MGPERTICYLTLTQMYHAKLQDLVADFQPQERTSIFFYSISVLMTLTPSSKENSDFCR